MATLRSVSKDEYGASERPTIAEINAGSLQRMADATEKMAQSYDAIVRNRDYWQRECQDARRRKNWLLMSNASLRGWITRLKRRPVQ